MKIKLKEARNEGVKGGVLRMVADGFNAPVTAGNFIDLVDKKFYDNMEVQRADGFIVQTGNPGNEVCLEGLGARLGQSAVHGVQVWCVPAAMASLQLATGDRAFSSPGTSSICPWSGLAPTLLGVPPAPGSWVGCEAAAQLGPVGACPGPWRRAARLGQLASRCVGAARTSLAAWSLCQQAQLLTRACLTSPAQLVKPASTLVQLRLMVGRTSGMEP